MKEINVEYPFLDSVEIKPFFGLDWLKWSFGAWCEETGTIFIYMDNILKAYELLGKGKIEDWLCSQLTFHLTHDVIHALQPSWNEEQVVRATTAIFGGEKN